MGDTYFFGCDDIEQVGYVCKEGLIHDNCTKYCERINLLKDKQEEIAELFGMSTMLFSNHGDGLCTVAEGCWNKVATELGMCISNYQRKNSRSTNFNPMDFNFRHSFKCCRFFRHH